MMAMQYSFVLPADYDMEIITRRIRDKGHLLNGFPHLRFKAYLFADRKDGDIGAQDNLYAPFYLWDAPEGADQFLTGPGFEAVSRDFGRPSVETWIGWHAELDRDLSQARYASREIRPIAPDCDLQALRARSAEGARNALKDNDAIACLTAFDPTSWNTLRFCLWQSPPERGSEDTQLYRVGYVALP
ncbi:DUF4865 family protein [uncultured Roseibium sp.]|uniref:DUF4865 family protein n=1 Tax=uncultured Roseibium sp. TaxID=1936171 RepID=UPI003216F443